MPINPGSYDVEGPPPNPTEDLYPVVLRDERTGIDTVVPERRTEKDIMYFPIRALTDTCKDVRNCPLCQSVIDACHDSASMMQMLLNLDPDSTAPPVGFELKEEE